jgi:hypothetical protein
MEGRRRRMGIIFAYLQSAPQSRGRHGADRFLGKRCGGFGEQSGSEMRLSILHVFLCSPKGIATHVDCSLERAMNIRDRNQHQRDE